MGYSCREATMPIRFGIIILTALIATTGISAQILTQIAEAPLQEGQMRGEGQEWGILEYEGSQVQWGLWGIWGVCTGTCELGVRRRQRICYGTRIVNGQVQDLGVPANADVPMIPGTRQGALSQGPYEGPGCFGYLVEAIGCRLQPCSARYGSWEEWVICDRPCGGGTQSRKRACLGNSGCPVGSLTQNQQCNIQPCEVIPQWGPWTDWGSCSAPCGGGTQTRSRRCSRGSCPAIGGSDTRQCNIQICAVGWGEWSDLGQCSAPCGGGTQSRTRPCLSGNCPSVGASESVPCNVAPCGPQWGLWLEWSECTKPCGGGTQSRTRPCLSGNCPTTGGSETIRCNILACPTVGFWSAWGAYSSCTASCGQGSKTRTRVCIGSRNCAGTDEEIVSCTIQSCVGTWGAWGSYSICTRECGGGTRRRTRSCSAFGTCPGIDEEIQPCNQQNCVIYTWGSWQPFGRCSPSCGQGTYTRSRTCLANGAPTSNSACNTGGGDATETQFCYGPPCVSWGSWGLWQGCSASCGSGQDRRVRPCISNGQSVPESNCNALSGSATEQRNCIAGPCYSLGLWREWTSCSAPCGSGTQTRTRPCLANGRPINLLSSQSCGALVEPLTESRSCTIRPCYSIGRWGDWGACSTPCGPGLQSRYRPCLANGSPVNLAQGQSCGASIEALELLETRRCIVKACYVWSQWSSASCSVTCGTGRATKVRECRNSNGNKAPNGLCPAEDGGAEFQSACQRAPCLSWDLWGEWQSCSKTCGPGEQLRARPCLSNGRPVDNSVCASIDGNPQQERDCFLGPCYSIGLWGGWGDCSASCGPGSQTRTRPCIANGLPANLVPGQNCGSLDNPLLETRSCIEKLCVSWAAWGQWQGCSSDCGAGKEIRVRACVSGGQVQASSACDTLSGSPVQERGCNAGPCYSWSLWSSFTPCSASCGEGQSRRSRGCVAEDGSVASDSSVCPDPSRLGSLQIRSCRIAPCYSWQAWSTAGCSVTCGAGVAKRTRLCLTTNGKIDSTGASCPDPKNEGIEHSSPCNRAPCYSWTSWSRYSSCSSSCGPGQQTKTRRCVALGGADTQQSRCRDPLKVGASETRSCTGGLCYRLGDWGTWSRCTSSCGQGTINRVRKCQTFGGADAPNAACAGYKEEDFILRGTCIRPPCPGTYGRWTEWGPCTRTCNSGTRTRTRACLGAGCSGISREVTTCNAIPCGSTTVIIGTWSVWGQWGQCDAPCGGSRNKTRTCIRGRKPSDCGSEDYVRTIKCAACNVGGSVISNNFPAVVTSGNSCLVENSKKRQCQPDTIPEEICILVRCCYDDKYISEGVPACYYQAPGGNRA